MCHTTTTATTRLDSSDFNTSRMASSNLSVKLTSDGHVEGMLDRDQRTAKIRNSIKGSAYVKCRYSRDCGGDVSDKLSQTFPKNYAKFTNASSKRSFQWKSLQRLRQVLVVSLYLLSVVNFPKSIAAPIETMELKKEFWINPCNYKDVPSTTDTEVSEYSLKGILNQSHTAIVRVQQFLREYEDSLKFVSDILKTMHYKWFSSNKVSEMSEEQLMTLELDEFVVDAYECLQKYAAVFDLVVAEVDTFQGSFRDTMHFLKLLLCEIQEYMYNKKISQLPDVRRSDITNEFKLTDVSGRSVRDWIVLRDYTATIQKIDAVFRHMTAST